MIYATSARDINSIACRQAEEAILVRKNTIYPLTDQPQYPLAGEEVLASMLQWDTGSDGRPGPLAGVIQLNWQAREDSGPVYDRVVSGRQRPLFSLSVEQAMIMLDGLEREGMTPKIVYFTGADPGSHPQLGEFVELARQSGISQVGLQCSGPRLAHDDDLLDVLNRLKPFLFVEFDGFDETASLILHGRRDLPFEAKRGLDRLATAGLPATLLTSVVRGVNLHEVGAIAAFGLNHPAVFSVIFRPVSPRLARLGVGPSNHVTAFSLMAALEQQSDGLFRQDAFTPALCCRPERHFYAEIPYVDQNGSTIAGQSGTGLASIGHCLAPNGASCFWLGVHDFMTPWSKDLDQAQRCPLVIMTPDGRTIPYCLYNTLDD
jgi:uncharacterized radical SAM superfamily Fe-S cluster-containing enzyme